MKNNWLILHYDPVSLFSLRTTYSTSSGGKTLLIPTPYTFKLALVSAGFRMGGEKNAREIFDVIKGQEIKFSPPEHLTVNHTFIKIKREPKQKTPEQPFNSSIAFREFCYYQGEMQIAVQLQGLPKQEVDQLVEAAAHIHYFGKQGSFFQFTGFEQIEALSKGFMLHVPEELELADTHYQVTQYLDDLGEVQTKDLFERINTYSSKTLELHKHRILKQYLLPYHLKRENNRYSYYRRSI